MYHLKIYDRKLRVKARPSWKRLISKGKVLPINEKGTGSQKKGVNEALEQGCPACPKHQTEIQNLLHQVQICIPPLLKGSYACKATAIFFLFLCLSSYI